MYRYEIRADILFHLASHWHSSWLYVSDLAAFHTDSKNKTIWRINSTIYAIKVQTLRIYKPFKRDDYFPRGKLCQNGSYWI